MVTCRQSVITGTLPWRMLGPPIRALPVGGGEVDGECLVGQGELFRKSQILRTERVLFGVVDLNHGDCSQGISRSGRYT